MRRTYKILLGGAACAAAVIVPVVTGCVLEAIKDLSRVNGDISRVNDYGDALVTHKKLTALDTKKCRTDLADVFAFITESKRLTGWDWGKSYWGKSAEKSADDMDANPCPAIEDCRRHGSNAFALKFHR